jgi:segregation and condensation protein B
MARQSSNQTRNHLSQSRQDAKERKHFRTLRPAALRLGVLARENPNPKAGEFEQAAQFAASRKGSMEREDIKSILESLLFISDGPVPLQRLHEVIDGASREEIRSALDELRDELETSRRGVRLVEVAGGFQMRTPKVNADWVKKFLGGRPARMGRATLETLAIVAYRQPITKAEIEAIRGVDVDGVMNTLLERDLIRAVARKDVPGRPFLYGTTQHFLELFNLKELSELPTLKEMEEITLPEVQAELQAEEELVAATSEEST